MIKNTLEKIEASIQKLKSVDPAKKDEMVRLLSTLKSVGAWTDR